MDNRHPAEAPNLSQGQKRDLFGMTVLAVISTGFFVTPILLTPAATPPSPSARSLPAERVAVVATEVMAPITPYTLAPEPMSRGARHASGTRFPSRPHARVRRASSTSTGTPRLAAGNRTPLPGRLARLIAGDGRYQVRPFPSVEPAQR
jgi:hypothetical protein